MALTTFLVIVIAMTQKSTSKISRQFLKERDDPRVETWRKLLVFVESTYEALEKKLNEKDCSYPRFRLLFVLYFEAPCGPASLAKRLHVSRSNLTTFLRRLEEDGLITPCIVSSSETRLKYVLTKKGSEHIEKLMVFHFENIKKLSLFSRPQLLQELTNFLRENQIDRSF